MAFCDADGEYDPDELERLVAPILAGDADYVVGSRFAGLPRPHAPPPLGRQPGADAGGCAGSPGAASASRGLTDGQSGYRALSPAAAADAEVIHDFNYAQVLTFDLLAKGHRYAEVPISYRFRTTGRSFVRLRPLPPPGRPRGAGRAARRRRRAAPADAFLTEASQIA